MYTYRNGLKYPLAKMTDQVIVRGNPADIPFHGIEINEATSPNSTRLTVAPQCLDLEMMRLRERFITHHAYQELQTQTPFLITDRIIVSFKGTPQDDDISLLINTYALELLTNLTGRDFLFRLTDNTAINPVKLVVKMTEVNHDFIEYVDHDLNLVATCHDDNRAVMVDQDYIQQWHLHDSANHPQIDARSSSNCDKAWELMGTFGDPSIVIGVTDDGCLLNHRDFNGSDKFAGWAYMQNNRVVANNSFGADVDKMYQPGQNHGTSCAGVCAAEKDGVLTVGAAPECSLLPLKWESNGGSLFISDAKILTALNFLKDKVDIISNSWGSSPQMNFSNAVNQRVAHLAKHGGRRGKGILFLWAAGNENCPIQLETEQDTPYTNGWARHPFTGAAQWVGVTTAKSFSHSLVGIEGVLHIAAMSSTAQRAHYSNYGPGIDVAAPSSNSHSYWRMQISGLGVTTTTGESNEVTEQFGGTSSATPLVAGIAALILSANDQLSAIEVADILRQTASKEVSHTGYAPTPAATFDGDTSWDVSPIAPFNEGGFNDEGWSPWFGFGKVDAELAVKKALELKAQSITITTKGGEKKPDQ